MTRKRRPIRVLIAKPGLDGHDLGAKLVCRALVDAGMEVIYTGLRHSPEAIAGMAVEEDVDVVGLSMLSGAHLNLAGKVVAHLSTRGAGDILVIAGGNIPAEDCAALETLGVASVFRTSSPFEAMVNFLEEKVVR